MAGLKDIAQMAGVSVRTVSRALKGNGYVREEIREQILDIARQLNYRPNRHAQSLKTSKSYEVLALAWSLDELHASKIKGLEQALRPEGYWLSLLAAAPDEKSATSSVPQEVANRYPAAVVAIGVGTDWQKELVLQIAQTGIPCLFFDTPYTDAARKSGEALPGVYIDRQSGVYEAVRYLHGIGRTKIRYAGIKRMAQNTDQTRLAGYHKAVEELGIEADIRYYEAPGDSYCYDGAIAEGQFAAGEAAARDILSVAPEWRPQAVQTFTDIMAMGMLSVLHGAGVRIPQDIAIVGFDGRSASQFSSPPLTTVVQPGLEVGQEAARLLLSMLEGDKEKSESTGEADNAPDEPATSVLPTRLVVRGSA